MMATQEAITEALNRRTGEEVAVEWRLSPKGVVTGWCRLGDTASILPAAQAVADLKGRLSMVTTYLPEAARRTGLREIAYHFDLDGATLTIRIQLPPERAQVPSLTPIFRNADWNEREFMELYDIQVTGHPDPRRLFLDESIEPAVFERLIPYSTFSNGATGKELWERVMADNAREETP